MTKIAPGWLLAVKAHGHCVLHSKPACLAYLYGYTSVELHID